MCIDILAYMLEFDAMVKSYLSRLPECLRAAGSGRSLNWTPDSEFGFCCGQVTPQ